MSQSNKENLKIRNLQLCIMNYALLIDILLTTLK